MAKQNGNYGNVFYGQFFTYRQVMGVLKYQALKFLKLDSLKERRVKMALRFAKRSLKLEHFSRMFPLNDSNHLMTMRNPEKYVVNISKSKRHKRSAVPFLQRLLNEDYLK